MTTNKQMYTPPVEKELYATSGFTVLILDVVLSILALGLIILGPIVTEQVGTTAIVTEQVGTPAIVTEQVGTPAIVTEQVGTPAIVSVGVILLIAGILWLACPAWVLLFGFHVIRPNEALVLTLFGKYIGTLKTPGFYFTNPFCSAVNPVKAMLPAETESKGKNTAVSVQVGMGKKLSLKTMTLNNEKQKINDLLGNPIVIGIAVIWRVSDTAKAVFAVDNYHEFLSIQCDSALRNIVRLYPYDIAEQEGDEKSLRGSSQEIAENLKQEIASRVQEAGLEILEARITHLAYAPEIAAVMLQRQQASAVIDARKMIVDGAVGMVEMALEKLSEKQIVELDEERKAQMVSNLMVVLCSSKDAQPVVNSGSLY